MDSLPINNLPGDYADPVRRLLSFGKVGGYKPAEWPDYAEEFGIGVEHAEDLTRIACDDALHNAPPDSAELWAPLHAWRALAQLRAETAIAPLLAVLTRLGDDDAACDELPRVFGMIGPAAITPLGDFLSDRSNPIECLVTAQSALAEIGARHPESRTDCVGILARALEPRADEDHWLNGMAVSALLDLRAVEAIDTIRAAFQRKAVELWVAGDEEDVEIELGLRERRATLAPRFPFLPADWWAPSIAERLPRGAQVLPKMEHVSPKKEKVGRNAPCPCGSGKKYKKCCLP